MSGSGTPIYDPDSGNPNGTGKTLFPGNIIPTQPDRSRYAEDYSEYPANQHWGRGGGEQLLHKPLDDL